MQGASFRSKAQVLALAGCDKLTIAPKLLGELRASTDPVKRHLEAGDAKEAPPAKLSEPQFRWQHNGRPPRARCARSHERVRRRGPDGHGEAVGGHPSLRKGCASARLRGRGARSCDRWRAAAVDLEKVLREKIHAAAK
jgi:hypothetical protein